MRHPIRSVAIALLLAASACDDSHEVTADAGAVDAAALDAAIDAAAGPVCGTFCAAQEAPCVGGVWTCEGSTPTCQPTFNITQGTSCGDGLACDGLGRCVAPSASDAGIDMALDAPADASEPDAAIAPSLIGSWRVESGDVLNIAGNYLKFDRRTAGGGIARFTSVTTDLVAGFESCSYTSALWALTADTLTLFVESSARTQVLFVDLVDDDTAVLSNVAGETQRLSRVDEAAMAGEIASRCVNVQVDDEQTFEVSPFNAAGAFFWDGTQLVTGTNSYGPATLNFDTGAVSEPAFSGPDGNLPIGFVDGDVWVSCWCGAANVASSTAWPAGGAAITTIDLTALVPSENAQFLTGVFPDGDGLLVYAYSSTREANILIRTDASATTVNSVVTSPFGLAGTTVHDGVRLVATGSVIVSVDADWNVVRTWQMPSSSDGTPLTANGITSGGESLYVATSEGGGGPGLSVLRITLP